MAVDLLLAVLIAFGPSGGFVAASMAPLPPSEVEAIVVPRAWIHEALGPVEVVLFEATGAAGLLGGGRSLYVTEGPGGQRSRILLRRDVTAWRVGEMPTDVAEAFFDAVLAARVDRLRREPETEAFVARRAEALFRSEIRSEVGSEVAIREIYVDAVASFGASLLAVGVQIERIHARRGAALCPLIRDGRLLFGHWRRTIESAAFRGLLPAAAPGGDARWSRAVLAPEDKAWLVREVVGAEWTGDPSIDFAALCR